MEKKQKTGLRGIFLRLVLLRFLLLVSGSMMAACGSAAVTISIAGKGFELNGIAELH